MKFNNIQYIINTIRINMKYHQRFLIINITNCRSRSQMIKVRIPCSSLVMFDQ